MKFEKISAYANDETLRLPERKTSGAAGYDFMVAEDTVIPPYEDLMGQLVANMLAQNGSYSNTPMSLAEVAAITKANKIKPTLVPTGIKCELPKDKYLELSVRSSCPLKYWLVLANGVGIIDADYYNNTSNEGHLFFQLINLSPFPIQLKKGDIIGQGIIKDYYVVDDDVASGIRTGGFGSTSV